MSKTTRAARKPAKETIGNNVTVSDALRKMNRFKLTLTEALAKYEEIAEASNGALSETQLNTIKEALTVKVFAQAQEQVTALGVEARRAIMTIIESNDPIMMSKVITYFLALGLFPTIDTVASREIAETYATTLVCDCSECEERREIEANNEEDEDGTDE